MLAGRGELEMDTRQIGAIIPLLPPLLPAITMKCTITAAPPLHLFLLDPVQPEWRRGMQRRTHPTLLKRGPFESAAAKTSSKFVKALEETGADRLTGVKSEKKVFSWRERDE